MSALSTFEIGQPALALPASSWNFAASMPGTFAFSTRCDLVTVQPLPSTFSSETVAVASRLSGVKPAVVNWPERAIAKQPEWAAAMSSSGFVPGALSKRMLNEYGVFLRAPPGAVSVPLPSLMVPFQTAVAVRLNMRKTTGTGGTERCKRNAGAIGSSRDLDWPKFDYGSQSLTRCRRRPIAEPRRGGDTEASRVE
jgi:hypothetical protein